jgi:hypothetical protein
VKRPTSIPVWSPRAASTPQEKTSLERQIATTDMQIDLRCETAQGGGEKNAREKQSGQ